MLQLAQPSPHPLTRLMQQALFEVDAADPRIALGVLLTLLAVAELASRLPARRATPSDTVVALRLD